ncbi:MAG: CopG family transcriptional regulator [Gammaproteobacteria bacterium]|nr:CopG family transcriptional regulator [Gammaproteobacteria bacterium]
MKAKKFDTDFNAGKNVTGSLDLSKIKRPNQEQRRVNVDFPTWMIDSLDKEATRLGVTRQSIIKVWLAEKLESAAQ